MQVIIKQNYRGPLGTFRKGQTVQLHPRIVELMPEGYCEPVKEKPKSSRQNAIDHSPKDKQMRPGKTEPGYKTK